VEEHEWNDFVEYWNDEMRRQWKWHVPSRERSAIIVFRGYNQWCLKQKVELTEKKTHNKVVNEHSTIRVAKTGLYRDIHTWVQGLRVDPDYFRHEMRAEI
jgi:hypothetical protein